MNNVMQRAASALGVAVVGVIVSRSTAQLTSDTSALQTPWAFPRYSDADRQTLLGLYSQTQAHIQATADADAFLVTAGLAVVAAVLVLMLRKPPPPAAPTTGSPASSTPAEPRTPPATTELSRT
jgi:hypothetical protein